MKRLHLPFVTILLLCMTIWAQAIEWDNSKFMALDEIKQGMQGKVKTVFSGNKIEEFNMEVINIEKNALPQWDVIWARGWGGTFDETGIANGMSGSPVYINGRLIGAVSLGAYNQKKGDLFGITPIELMLKVTQKGMNPKLSYGGGSGEVMPFFTINHNSADDEIGLFSIWPSHRARHENHGVNLYSNPQGMRLQIPATYSGFSPQAINYIQPLLEEYGMCLLQGGGGGGSVDTDVPIEPGQVMGFEFARGDFSLSALATLTYVEGNQLLGWGHSFFGEGNMNIPLSVGYVNYVLPLITRSAKMSSSIKTIGTLVQDRQPAIAGILGASPSFIPVNLRVKTQDGVTKELHYEVIRHQRLSAGYAILGTLSLVDAVDKSSGDSTAHVHTVISLKDQPDIIKDDFYSSSLGAVSAAYESLSPLYSLINNPFQKVEVENIAVDISIQDKRNTAPIEGVRINKNRYKPGDEIQMFITLRPYLEHPIIQKATVTIPKDMPDGVAVLLISSVTSNESWQKNRAPLNFQPKNIQQLIKLLQRGESRNNIIIEIYVPKIGMTVQGEEMPELPLSMLSVMTHQTQTEGGFTRGTTLLREKLPTKYFISGGAGLRLIIDRNAP
ncbi:hypothetical protein H8E77_22695 [bacterium]|nr:hypothetical protein [bacterium]